jgi:hypothetical protein
MVHPEIKAFENCQRPSLVRMNIGGSASFTFLGLERTAFLPAFTLGTDGRWQVHNLSNDWGILSEFENATVVDFGNKFEIRPDYSASCQIKTGELFHTSGAVIRTGDQFLLAAHAPKNFRDPIVYLELGTGRYSGEPGGQKVAFSSWSLHTSPEAEKALFSFVALPIG